ncbi:MAG: hypothetical protein M1343_08140 [Chloroflexi bacterium]|nr:hypothetical protein [Chloroflexota bacterium]
MSRHAYVYPEAVIEETEDLKAVRGEIEDIEAVVAALTATRDKREIRLAGLIRNGADRQHLLAELDAIEEINERIEQLTGERDKAEEMQDIEIELMSVQAVSHCESCLQLNACKSFEKPDLSRRALSQRVAV